MFDIIMFIVTAAIAVVGVYTLSKMVDNVDPVTHGVLMSTWVTNNVSIFLIFATIATVLISPLLCLIITCIACIFGARMDYMEHMRYKRSHGFAVPPEGTVICIRMVESSTYSSYYIWKLLKPLFVYELQEFTYEVISATNVTRGFTEYVVHDLMERKIDLLDYCSVNNWESPSKYYSVRLSSAVGIRHPVIELVVH